MKILPDWARLTVGKALRAQLDYLLPELVGIGDADPDAAERSLRSGCALALKAHILGGAADFTSQNALEALEAAKAALSTGGRAMDPRCAAVLADALPAWIGSIMPENEQGFALSLRFARLAMDGEHATPQLAGRHPEATLRSLGGIICSAMGNRSVDGKLSAPWVKLADIDGDVDTELVSSGSPPDCLQKFAFHALRVLRGQADVDQIEEMLAWTKIVVEVSMSDEKKSDIVFCRLGCELAANALARDGQLDHWSALRAGLPPGWVEHASLSNFQSILLVDGAARELSESLASLTPPGVGTLAGKMSSEILAGCGRMQAMVEAAEIASIMLAHKATTSPFPSSKKTRL